MKRLFALFFLFLMSGPFLQANTLSDVLSQIKARESVIQTASFTFHQDIDFHHMQSHSEVSGNATFKSPNFIRIEKFKPAHQISVSNGKATWIYTPAYKQVWEGVQGSWMEFSAIPQGLFPLQGLAKTLENDFNLALASDQTPGTIKIRAKPKSSDNQFELIITVDSNSWLPVKTLFKSETATIETRIEGIQLNFDLPEKFFGKNFPDDVEVIKVQ